MNFLRFIREFTFALKEDIDSFKSLDDITTNFKERICDDFNRVSTEYGKYQIIVRKGTNREKNIKQLLDGALKIFAVGVSGKIIVT